MAAPPRPITPAAPAPGRARSAAPAAMGVSLADNPFARVAFYCALAILFLKFGLLHEYIAYKTGVDIHSMLIFGGAAILATILGGGLQRAFGFRPAVYWILFGMWLVATLPFSFWPGGSTTFLFKSYFRVTYGLLFVLAGLSVTLVSFRRLMYAIAIGAAASGYIGRAFASVMGYRTSVEFGSIKNPGDLAAHFLLTLPFLVFVWQNTRSTIVRIATLALAVSNMGLVLSTATRAALIGIATGLLFFIVQGTMKQRTAIVLIAIAGVLTAMAFLPEPVLKRYATIWSSANDETMEEAVGSTEARKDLMKRALQYVGDNPVFGTGPGTFADYDAHRTRALTGRAQWQGTHNAYLEIAVEGGLIAFVFYVAAMISAFRMMLRLMRESRHDPSRKLIRDASFCLALAMVIHGTSLFFLSLGYAPYMPMLIGLSCALYGAARRQTPQAPPMAAATTPLPAPARSASKSLLARNRTFPN